MNANEVRSKFVELDVVRNKYESYGTYDTEPRDVIAQVVEMIMSGKRPNLSTINWQLYDKEGEEQAIKDLTEALSGVVEAIGQTSVFESNSDEFIRVLDTYCPRWRW